MAGILVRVSCSQSDALFLVWNGDYASLHSSLVNSGVTGRKHDKKFLSDVDGSSPLLTCPLALQSSYPFGTPVRSVTAVQQI